MADNQFDILIKFGLSKEKAGEAINELKKVGQEGVKQEKEVKDATDKTTTSKHKLLDAMKGLSYEFPILGKVGRLAMNPISASVAGVIAAFGAAKQVIANVQQAFSGWEIPSANRTKIDAVNETTAAFEKQLTVVNGLVAAHAKLSDAQEKVATDAKFLRAIGLDLGTGPEESQQALASAAAQQLFASGSDKVSRGSRISPAQLEKLKADATAASEVLEKQKERKQFLQDYAAGRKSSAQFLWRYGPDSSLAEANAAEDQTSAQAQAALDRYQTASNRSALYTQGRSEMEQAVKLTRSNVSSRRELAADSGSQIAGAANQLGSAGVADLPASALKLANAVSESARLFKQTAEEVAALKARVNTLSERP